MKKLISILATIILLSPIFVFADVIIENNGDTTVTGDLNVQGTLSGPDIQKPLAGSCPEGSSIRALYPSGTIICEVDTDTDTDTLGEISCSTNQIIIWNGSAWVCGATPSPACIPGDMITCYEGTQGTMNVGLCGAGTRTCTAQGAFGSCAGQVLPASETCDGLDNNCDASVDNGMTAPLNEKQAGVCSGSEKTCDGANGWITDYSGISAYETVEVTCSDGLDNDCDGAIEEADDCAYVYWTWVTRDDQWPYSQPPARNGATSSIDSNGNLWLFGGRGKIDSIYTSGAFNQLIKLTGTFWALQTGNTSEYVRYPESVYGTKGVPDPANDPGNRTDALSWMDSSGNFWLFGGYEIEGNFESHDIGTTPKNDLWKYDGTNWTWVSGSTSESEPGAYGTKGVADPANVPGARRMAVTWTDSNDNLWLFGGYGYDIVGAFGWLNDLWKFDGTNWTWVSGLNGKNKSGVYGTKGVTDPASYPGGRYDAVSWTDQAGNFWLFGGYGYDGGYASKGRLNDLWKFDGTSWTWVSGSDTKDQPGVYGTKNVTDPASHPGGRSQAVSWIDQVGNFWLFGGYGHDGYATYGPLNDLWKFDGTNWTWISGSDTTGQAGVYGTMGVPDLANVPPAGLIGVSWIDQAGGFNILERVDLDPDIWKFELP